MLLKVFACRSASGLIPGGHALLYWEYARFDNALMKFDALLDARHLPPSNDAAADEKAKHSRADLALQFSHGWPAPKLIQCRC